MNSLSDIWPCRGLLSISDVVVEEDMAHYTQGLADTAKGPECEAGVGEGSLWRRDRERDVQQLVW